MKVGFSALALADAEEAADWYVDHDAWHAAKAFYAELAKAVGRIGADPGIGTPASGDVRILPIHRFPYSLVYRVGEVDAVRIIAVAAQRRRPGFWRGRR